MPVLWVLTAILFSDNRAEGRRSYGRCKRGRSGHLTVMRTLIFITGACLPGSASCQCGFPASGN